MKVKVHPQQLYLVRFRKCIRCMRMVWHMYAYFCTTYMYMWMVFIPPFVLSLSLSLSLSPSLPHIVPSLSLTLDPSGGYYHLLPSPHSALKPDLHEQQLMYTLSLTLSNAKQLPNVRHNECTTTYLLDNAMSSIPY